MINKYWLAEFLLEANPCESQDFFESTEIIPIKQQIKDRVKKLNL